MTTRYLTLITVLLILTFALPLSAQKRPNRGSLSSFAEDTSIYPHDFNDEYYAANGVFAPSIIKRRDGTDFLSVYGLSSNPAHRNVRVLAALPAYNENGEIRFWAPLGELAENGFTEDGNGAEARAMAQLYPIFVFPLSNKPNAFFTNARQAALVDESQNSYYLKGNPLGLRTIILVNFTEKAFNTEEGVSMMDYLGKKNGLSLDGTPILKYRNDIDQLFKLELITMEKRGSAEVPALGGLWEELAPVGRYAISPVIDVYAVKGAIAPDAFLLMATRDGKSLADEMMFVNEFGCLQKLGTP